MVNWKLDKFLMKLYALLNLGILGLGRDNKYSDFVKTKEVINLMKEK